MKFKGKAKDKRIDKSSQKKTMKLGEMIEEGGMRKNVFFIGGRRGPRQKDKWKIQSELVGKMQTVHRKNALHKVQLKSCIVTLWINPALGHFSHRRTQNTHKCLLNSLARCYLIY